MLPELLSKDPSYTQLGLTLTKAPVPSDFINVEELYIPLGVKNSIGTA